MKTKTIVQNLKAFVLGTALIATVVTLLEILGALVTSFFVISMGEGQRIIYNTAVGALTILSLYIFSSFATLIGGVLLNRTKPRGNG